MSEYTAPIWIAHLREAFEIKLTELEGLTLQSGDTVEVTVTIIIED
jgi:hypothetical protein